jgi:phosphoribosylamine--glycine ligase
MVCGSMAEADAAIDAMLLGAALGEAGSEILVEEFMEGEELSLFAITDGSSVLPMLPAQDHKRLFDGDRGPNTGGMGAYAPVALATPTLMDRVASEILLPTLSELREHGAPFSGLLYAGLMLTADGPKVVEFNCRFGDPETQAILPLLDSSLLEPLAAVATGSGITSSRPLAWRNAAAVTTVLAADGYPGVPRSGDVVVLPEPAAGVTIFHAGTRTGPDGSLVSSGGRVLAVTAVAESIEAARKASVATAERVRFSGKQFRRDIGWRESERHAGAS